MTTGDVDTIKDKPKRTILIALISISYILIGGVIAIINLLIIVLHLYEYLLIPIGYIVSGIIAITTGVGFWKLKRWAYQAAIVISGLFILINSYWFFSVLSHGKGSLSFIPIIFHGLFLIGLFSKHVKAIFTSS